MGEDYDSQEYWADAFANYVGHNIDTTSNRGKRMAYDVNDALTTNSVP